VSTQDGSSHHLQNQILQRSKQQHPNISLLAIQQNQPRHIQASNSGYEDTIQANGEDVLHIKKEIIGTHSIRSGTAMAMFSGNCSVCPTMMISRWSSDAFLRYI
jgi:hypothetical protein